jgi:TetR/AcrR family transcriptional regulator of autoinduction and epiphytic fitness
MHVIRLTEQKREAILAAALAEFEARGFRETSMDRIAATARVSKRTVYNHFASKDALFDAISTQLIERVQGVADECYDPAQPIETQLRTIGGQVLDMLAAPSFLALARVTLGELLRSPDLARRTYELFRERQTGLARWLGAAARDGRLDVDDPVWAADEFFGLINAFALWPQLLGGQPVPDDAARRRILDAALSMFLAARHTG